MRYRVQDVMTGDVACARENIPHKELVKLLASRRVSALPLSSPLPDTRARPLV